MDEKHLEKESRCDTGTKPVGEKEAAHAKKCKGETPFQIFWFSVNISLVLLLTICVKMGPNTTHVDLRELGTWDPSFLYKHLQLGKLGIVQNTGAFDAIVTTIFSTGILSICPFAVMKKLKFFHIPDSWATNNDDSIDRRSTEGENQDVERYEVGGLIKQYVNLTIVFFFPR